MYRNTFINSPRLLDDQLRLSKMPRLRFAGQITGVEGYVESAAIGGMAGRMAAAEITGGVWRGTAANNCTWCAVGPYYGRAMADSFQPMNVNFGLFPELEASNNKTGKRAVGAIAKRPCAACTYRHARLVSNDDGYRGDFFPVENARQMA